MKSQRIEIKLDLDAIESAIAEMIDVPNPLIALYGSLALVPQIRRSSRRILKLRQKG